MQNDTQFFFKYNEVSILCNENFCSDFTEKEAPSKLSTQRFN